PPSAFFPARLRKFLIELLDDAVRDIDGRVAVHRRPPPPLFDHHLQAQLLGDFGRHHLDFLAEPVQYVLLLLLHFPVQLGGLLLIFGHATTELLFAFPLRRRAQDAGLFDEILFHPPEFFLVQFDERLPIFRERLQGFLGFFARGGLIQDPLRIDDAHAAFRLRSRRRATHERRERDRRDRK